MAAVFWNAEDISSIYYIGKGRTIKCENNCTLLNRLNGKIREKRPGLAKKKIVCDKAANK